MIDIVIYKVLKLYDKDGSLIKSLIDIVIYKVLKRT